MKIIITGVAGFVAQHFLNYVNELNKPIEVLGFYHHSKPTFTQKNYAHIKLQLLQIDIFNTSSFEKAMVQFNPTHILHLAALSSVAESWKKPDEYILGNISMILNIAEVMRKHSLTGRLLSVGSAEEYGKLLENYPDGISEQTPSNPISPYGIARVTQRKIVELYAENFGLNIIHTRSFNHFGTGQKENFVIPSFAKQMVAQQLTGSKKVSLTVGDISVIRDFTDVRDVVSAYYLILLNGINGEVYNVCSGNSYTLKDILKQMAKLLQVELSYTTNKDYLRPNENKQLKGNPAKLKNSTGWTPKYNMETSLQDLLAYWKEKLSS